ncbi:flagellar motor switch protein FliG [Ectobacillus polymachus]|uniref:flagellar motor switch protein FliG n=1 Tax=Ectobacillus polymachus TaxID=1508806 RepID=UPI003A84ADF1
MVKYTNLQKIAILFLSVSPTASAEIMKHLHEDEIESITKEITNLRMVSSEVKKQVLREFHELAIANNLASFGGMEAAKELLQQSLGSEKASTFLHRLKNQGVDKPFQFVDRADSVQILNLLQHESAQTIALVLSYLDADKSSTILSAFSPEKQIDIAKRIAIMDTASPEMIQQVEQVLKERLSTTSTRKQVSKNGIQSIVNILNGVDRSTEKNILETLQTTDPQLADEIKQRMFVFDDIAYLDNRSIQRILVDVSNEDLQLALRSTTQTMKNAIYRNISKRRQDLLEEEIAANDSVLMKDVEDAQKRIVSMVRKLEEDGIIIISRNGGDDLVI